MAHEDAVECVITVSCLTTSFAAIHEKLFIAFMVSSLCYQVITIMLFRWSHPQPMLPEVGSMHYRAFGIYII